MSNPLSTDKAYKEWLRELIGRIHSSQTRAALQVNTTMLELYWSIGRDIVHKQSENGWGTGVIPQLSKDLRSEFVDVQGFSERNLRDMRRFYKFYQGRELIRQQHVAELAEGVPSRGVMISSEAINEIQSDVMSPILVTVPWRHHLEIISHVSTIEEALFYIQKAAEEGWSKSTLTASLQSDLFSRQGSAPNNFTELLLHPQSDLAGELLKDPYNFDFITLTNRYKERELEDALVDNITKFLLELGKGFAYIGRQVPISVGSKELAIDLLLYHTTLHSYVVIELKAVEFEAEFTGKLGVYVAAVDDQMRTADDNQTIGLLICKTKDNVYAEYSLRSSSKPIGISAYKLSNLLPADFKSSLPSIEDIEANLSDADAV